jgi:hypothetical protein
MKVMKKILLAIAVVLVAMVPLLAVSGVVSSILYRDQIRTLVSVLEAIPFQALSNALKDVTIDTSDIGPHVLAFGTPTKKDNVSFSYFVHGTSMIRVGHVSNIVVHIDVEKVEYRP